MRGPFPLTVAFTAILAAPLALPGCAAVEPQGGAPMALIGANGQTIGSVRAWQTSGGVSTEPDFRMGFMASMSMRWAVATHPILQPQGRTGILRHESTD